MKKPRIWKDLASYDEMQIGKACRRSAIRHEAENYDIYFFQCFLIPTTVA